MGFYLVYDTGKRFAIKRIKVISKIFFPVVFVRYKWGRIKDPFLSDIMNLSREVPYRIRKFFTDRCSPVKGCTDFVTRFYVKTRS